MPDYKVMKNGVYYSKSYDLIFLWSYPYLSYFKREVIFIFPIIKLKKQLKLIRLGDL